MLDNLAFLRHGWLFLTFFRCEPVRRNLVICMAESFPFKIFSPSYSVHRQHLKNQFQQVEHPVTEWIAEVNLPAAQVAVGMGIPLWQIPGMMSTSSISPKLFLLSSNLCNGIYVFVCFI